MASGRVHFVSNVTMGVGLSYLTWLYIPEVLPLAIAGLTIGTLITPDYDLEVNTYTEKFFKKIPVFGWIFLIGSYAYALLFKHRGSSHGWISGTLSRIIWLILFALFMFVVVVGIVFTFGIISDYLFSTTVIDYLYSYILEFISGIKFDTSNVVYYMMCTAIFIFYWYLQDWNHKILDALIKDRKTIRRRL